MIWRALMSTLVLPGILLLGCGGKTTSEESSSSQSASMEDLLVDTSQYAGGSSVHVKSGTEELKIDTQGSGEGSYTMELNSKEGVVKMSAGSAAKLPEGLPADVPTYPGMTLTLSQSVKDNETFNVMATSTDPFDKVVAFFKNETTAKGWTEATSQDQTEDGKQTHLFVGSKEGRVLTIIITSEEQGVSMAITSSKK